MRPGLENSYRRWKPWRAHARSKNHASVGPRLTSSPAVGSFEGTLHKFYTVLRFTCSCVWRCCWVRSGTLDSDDSRPMISESFPRELRDRFGRWSR